jgi:hypothetical protein
MKTLQKNIKINETVQQIPHFTEMSPINVIMTCVGRKVEEFVF